MKRWGVLSVAVLLLMAGCDTGSRNRAKYRNAATASGGGTTAPGGSGGVASPNSPGASSPGQFGLDPTVTDPQDIWHVDFESLGDVFHRNCVGHGLGVASEPKNAPINKLVRDKVIARVLRRLNTAYLRNPDGSGISGQSIHITFTADPPDPAKFPGGPGTDYSRICIGSSQSRCGSGTLGVETVDPGNRRAERACQLDRLGTFAGRICGLNSTLGGRSRFGSNRQSGGPLTTADLKYVDGTYQLGAGTAAEDARFQEIDAVITDWATAIGNVVAHEIGHSVGLAHTRSGIMIGTTNARDLSDGNLSFTRPSLQDLQQNIGIQP